MNDSYLFDAGWLFFAIWSLLVGAVSVAAFSGDLFPSRERIEYGHDGGPARPVRPGHRIVG